MPAELIRYTGESEEIIPAENNIFTWEELITAINCVAIEMVDLADGRIMIVDEHGKLGNIVIVNERATVLFMQNRMDWKSWVKKMKEEFGDKAIELSSGNPELDNVIVGNVIVCTKDMLE